MKEYILFIYFTQTKVAKGVCVFYINIILCETDGVCIKRVGLDRRNGIAAHTHFECFSFVHVMLVYMLCV
jgi:hypothetical protein